MSDVGKDVDLEIFCIDDIDAASDFELKHTPNVEIEKLASGQLVKVSMGLKGLSHPQTAEHLIEWYKVYVDGELQAEAYFGADDEPVAEFTIDSLDEVVVWAFCNLHGIWQSI